MTFVNVRMLRLEQNGAAVELSAPTDHKLDYYRRSHPYYDVRLPRLAALVARERPGETMIDVGANIGDTIALCRLEGCSAPFIAVEPSSEFLPYLDSNANQGALGDVRILQAFVGTKPIEAETCPTLTLDTIAAGMPVSLIKTDTDGYDGALLLSALKYLKATRPILWAEIESTSAIDEARWRALLEDLGYGMLAVFDNYGFLFAAGAIQDHHGSLLDLVRYCRRGRAVRHHTIYHVDVALFPGERQQLFAAFMTAIEEAHR
jgi:hypothetical protein